MLKNRSVDVTPTVVRTAVGGAEFVKIFKVTNLVRCLEALKAKEFWIYGMDERGPKTLAETEFGGKVAFVIGAEGEGLRRLTREACDFLVRIPGGRQGVESLNAGRGGPRSRCRRYSGAETGIVTKSWDTSDAYAIGTSRDLYRIPPPPPA